MWRASLAAMLVVGAFWGVWYLITGSVPQTTELKMAKDWQITFPFAISRWWDIAFAGIWSAIIVFVFSKVAILAIKKDNLGVGLVFTLGYGLMLSLSVGLGASSVGGLIVSLIVVVVFGLSFCVKLLLQNV